MEEEKSYLICNYEGHGSIPGSTQTICTECGVVVEIAPSGQRKVANDGSIVLCMVCGMKKMENSYAGSLATGIAATARSTATRTSAAAARTAVTPSPRR